MSAASTPRREAVSRSMVERGEQALILLVAGDVANFRERLQFFDEARRPMAQLVGVYVFQGVLKFGAADAIFDGEILHRLHEERDAVDFGEFWLQAGELRRWR